MAIFKVLVIFILVKVEHHIHHLEESLKQFKIPKGLQINQEYRVMEKI